MARKPNPVVLTRGVVKLAKYMKEHGFSDAGFAKHAGLGRLQLHRILAGHTLVVSVDFALAIEKATEGRVVAKDFVASTRRIESGGLTARRRSAARCTISRRP